jgi:hypothetical protein
MRLHESKVYYEPSKNIFGSFMAHINELCVSYESESKMSDSITVEK